MIGRWLGIVLLAGILWLPASLVAQENPPGVTIHVVQRGENLFRIALHYGLTTEELARINGIADPNNIYVGQRLLVPVEGAAAYAQPQVHVVQAGETLRSIAEFYGKTIEELAALNAISDVNTIYVGQVLAIRAAASLSPSLTSNDATQSPTFVPTSVAELPTGSQLSPPASVIYTVQAGETLFRIATRYGITVNELATANGINDPTMIYAGQQLMIPGVEPPHLALDLPGAVVGLDITPLVLVEGQAGRIRLLTRVASNVSGTFLGRVLPFVSEQNNTVHTALTGIPLSTEAAVYPLSLTVTPTGEQTASFTVNIQILSGNYGRQTISLPGDKASLVDPAIDQNEIAILQRVTSVFTSERYFNGPMGLPAAAAMNSPFGTKRSYNGGPFTYTHLGADFAGAPGTPIIAPAPGRVVLADTLNIRGVVTVIDHGWGVFTTYSHQTERYVRLGDWVDTGQIIGTVGATGRATGAHLHWEVWVNGIPVDPMQWLSQSLS